MKDDGEPHEVEEMEEKKDSSESSVISVLKPFLLAAAFWVAYLGVIWLARLVTATPAP